MYRFVDQVELPFGRHAEQAFSAARFGPNSSDHTFRFLTLIEMCALVLDDKNASVVQEGDEIGIKLLVRELEPEG